MWNAFGRRAQGVIEAGSRKFTEYQKIGGAWRGRQSLWAWGAARGPADRDRLWLQSLLRILRAGLQLYLRTWRGRCQVTAMSHDEPCHCSGIRGTGKSEIGRLLKSFERSCGVFWRLQGCSRLASALLGGQARPFEKGSTDSARAFDLFLVSKPSTAHG